jgi:hypothetical protein
MTIRGVFFIGLFGVCSLWALAEPFAGIVAYVVHYHSYPERSWWGGGLSQMGIRYSFTITACLAAGTLLNARRLGYGPLLVRQEWLYLAFLGWIVLLGSATGQRQAIFRGEVLEVVTNAGEKFEVTDAVDKMVKLAVFTLAMTHVVVTARRLYQFTWTLVMVAAYLGFEAYTAPPGYYHQGRLEGIGGPDFTDSNMLAAHALALLPVIGHRFLHSGWKGKLACLAAGALTANTVVATRSRSAFLGAAVGFAAALLLAPKGGVRKLLPLALLVALGSVKLVDAGFLERMGTLESEKRDRDGAAQARLRVWGGAVGMLKDHPMGVGPSNFFAYIGNYVPEHAGRDAHQTYLRCAAELGVPGALVFAALILNAFRTLARVRSAGSGRPEAAEYEWCSYCIQISIIMYLTCGLFGSFIYGEMLWWLLLLPASLERVAANAVGSARPGEAAGFGPGRT